MRWKSQQYAIPLSRRALRLALDPVRIIPTIWKRFPVGSFKLRVDFDIFTRPHYVYCLYRAALLARALELPRISALEFGVAGGNGLVDMERVAALVTEETGVSIEVYGFDLASGLPLPVDYRDLPYTWRSGQFKMDVEALEERLSSAKLVLGDVGETVRTFVDDFRPAPIGMAVFDLDYWRSTRDALGIFDLPHEHLLPRVLCYFDDTVGPDEALHNDYVGELRAIGDFNDAHATRKVTPVHGLRHKRVLPADWCDAVYAMHAFEHPLYNTYIGGEVAEQDPLVDR
jgi:hypothetical protein